MKIAFVTPWYGPNIPGGAESEARHTAQYLQQAGYEVEVLTTCIRDFFADWGKNYYKSGIDHVNGVPVRRFSVKKRDKHQFDEINQKLIDGQRVSLEAQQTFINEMFHAPDLYTFIRQHCQHYLFFFIPYMFASTYFGAQICPKRSAIIPCLHDEGYAYMDIFRAVLPNVRALLFNTHSESKLATQLYGNPASQIRQVVGIGLDTEFTHDAQRFRQKYHLTEPFILYTGRRDGGKNVPLLLDYWQRYVKSKETKMKLVLIGPGDVALTADLASHVVDLGFVPLQDKHDAYAATTLLCQPSLNESFSLVIMESWLAETPVLVNGRCTVTREHCQRSNGGLYFANYDEFAATMDYLMTNPTKARQMGQNGRQYVLDNYQWPTVIEKYRQIIDVLAGSDSIE